MLISYSHKFIFIHVYKVAGTSIREALHDYAFNPDGSLFRRVWRRAGLHRVLFPLPKFHDLPGHALAVQVRDVLPPVIFQSFYKFAFVRNPWDWQVSLYEFALSSPAHPQHELIKSFVDFERYIEWRISDDKHLQKDFVVDEVGRLIVDFVGRFETIERDFAVVCARLGIECRLPRRNSTPHRHYMTYYTPRTFDLVAEAFREDIEFFGY